MSDAVLYRVMQDIQSGIQLLGLTGIDPANVRIQKVAGDRGLPLPAVVIAPTGETVAADGLNDRDDVAYDVTVTLVAADDQDQADNFEQELEWRQKVRRQFHAKRLGPLAVESVISFVKLAKPPNRDAWSANLFVSPLVIQCLCREPRVP